MGEHALDEGPVFEEIDRDECLDLLATQAVGRLAMNVPGASPFVVPVNFALDGDVVVFRTDPGTKLDLLRGEPVSFQVDEIPPGRREGWSVLVQGLAYEATHWEIEGLHLEPWAPGEKAHWVRIVPLSVTGRRIRLVDSHGGDRRGYM